MKSLVALSLCLAILTSPVQAEMRLIVLDVGEGQAILLQQEHRGILIDTGHAGMSVQVLARLQDHGIEHLDYLILTHLHPDHASGYFRIREAFPDTPVLYNFHPLPDHITPDMVRWLNRALSRDSKRRKLAAGDTINWRGATIQALWPDEFVNDNLNQHSLVLLIRYHEGRVLLMGDAGKMVERRLRQLNLPGPVNLLIAGHHGAADTGDDAFLAMLQPRYSVISVNSDNIRGYPAPDTLTKLQHVSTRVYRTDRDGELCFSLPGGTDKIAPCQPSTPDRQ